MPKKCEKPPREELEDCRDEKMTLHEIAAIYEVSIPTVKRWLKGYSLTNQKRSKKVITMPSMKSKPVGSLLDQAKVRLGARVREDRIRGYFLDGRPVKADDLILAAGLSLPQG